MSVRRWLGLTKLVQDGVENGSAAVERVQVEIAAVPFAILEAVPVVSGPARVVHVAHDGTVGGTHLLIRGVARILCRSVEAVIVETTIPEKHE